jgi:hypothetical protein
MSYSVPRLSHKDAGSLLYSRYLTRSVCMRYIVYRILVCLRTKIRMVSSLRSFRVRILDADDLRSSYFTLFDIKSNYLPSIVQNPAPSGITLNMLRTSRINPKLSAATHIFGQYDFNRAPMAPPGTIIIAHETPGRRRTWAPHGQDGWYIGPALEHCRCYTVYITKTRSNRIVETVESFPHKFTLSFPSSSELATQAAADLTHALLNPQPASPFCQFGDEQAIALRKLANIFVSVKPKNVNNKLAPQDEIENIAPQRVQTTVSPPRVASQDPNQSSLQYIITSPLTPNSHRRQHTPLRRIVTPQTPHVMVQRSARQQNLSQDMMAETLAQANH